MKMWLSRGMPTIVKDFVESFTNDILVGLEIETNFLYELIREIKK